MKAPLAVRPEDPLPTWRVALRGVKGARVSSTYIRVYAECETDALANAERSAYYWHDGFAWGATEAVREQTQQPT